MTSLLTGERLRVTERARRRHTPGGAAGPEEDQLKRERVSVISREGWPDGRHCTRIGT
jgi:hypothetical protein